MNHMAELHQIYVKELEEINKAKEFENDYLYNAMRVFCNLYERESLIKMKLADIQKDIATQINNECSDDR